MNERNGQMKKVIFEQLADKWKPSLRAHAAHLSEHTIDRMAKGCQKHFGDFDKMEIPKPVIMVGSMPCEHFARGDQ